MQFRADAIAASGVLFLWHETEWALVLGTGNSVRTVALLLVLMAGLMVSSGKGELLLVLVGGTILGLLFFLFAGCLASGYARIGSRQRNRPER